MFFYHFDYFLSFWTNVRIKSIRAISCFFFIVFMTLNCSSTSQFLISQMLWRAKQQYTIGTVSSLRSTILLRKPHRAFNLQNEHSTWFLALRSKLLRITSELLEQLCYSFMSYAGSPIKWFGIGPCPGKRVL